MRHRHRRFRLLVVALAIGVGRANWGQSGGGMGGSLGPDGRYAFPARAVPEKPVWLAIGPATVPEDQEVGGVVAIGPITIAGKVKGDVISFGGKIVLEKTASVSGHVTAVCAAVERADGAMVAGEVRAEAFPEVRTVDLGWPGLKTGALFMGATTIDDAATREAVLVLGGDVTVAKSASVTEIVVVGGNLTVAQGATVKTAHVVGGRLSRAGKPGEGDQVLSPVVLDTLAVRGPAAAGGVTTSFTAEQQAGPAWLNVQVSSLQRPSATLSVSGDRSSFQLGVSAIAAQREAARENTPPGQGGSDDWHWSYNQFGQLELRGVSVPPDAGQAILGSVAVAVGLSLWAQVSDDQGRRTSRQLQIAVPREAATLAMQVGATPARPSYGPSGTTSGGPARAGGGLGGRGGGFGGRY